MNVNAIARYDDETEAFYTAIRTLGYDEDDFEIRLLRCTPVSKPTSAVYDLIIVRRRCNGVEIAYPAVSSTAGLYTFLDDLFTGVFGVRAQS